MPEFDFDVIIVGSGPSGVSAAFPLLEAGKRVLLIDGGKEPSNKMSHPSIVHDNYISARLHDSAQWKWIVGERFESIQNRRSPSPKFRVPLYEYVFEDFGERNKISASNVLAVGSLARGGLSNAWGCGVSKYSEKELSEFPFSSSEMHYSYDRVSRRIGLSGRSLDDLSEYFGLDEFCQPPIEMDALHHHIFKGYLKHKEKIQFSGFSLGRSRVAALSQEHHDRQGCNLSSNCLWGCSRESLYSARSDLNLLRKYTSFVESPGLLVEKIFHVNGSKYLGVKNLRSGISETISAKRIIMAAGTLASTRLVLDALNYDGSRRLLTCPTAAFMLWLPKFLSEPSKNAFGLGQLSFAINFGNDVGAFGSTFSTTGIPVSEFSHYMPIDRAYAMNFLSSILSSCVVGNVFLPGSLSSGTVHLSNGSLIVDGSHSFDVIKHMQFAKNKLRNAFFKCGAILLPKSFSISNVGGDIHYAGTLPMRKRPVIGETNENGEVIGLDGIYVVDGASLPLLSEKSHTLTIMANADRVGRYIATL